MAFHNKNERILLEWTFLFLEIKFTRSSGFNNYMPK